MKPEIELVTTGAELLNGSVVNRHPQWLGSVLLPLGWRLTRDTTVPDDPAAIRDALLSALGRCDVVIVTGGLGPTSDDVTRDVAAAWMDARLVMHEPTRQLVLDAYRRRNKPLNEMVERHALVVEGADVLENRHGLAPGEHLQRGDKHLFLLPGPPREFHGVMRDQVLSWLEAQGVGLVRGHLVFQLCGLGESDIAAALEKKGFQSLNIETAYCATPARVTLRIFETPGCAADLVRARSLVVETLGAAIYSECDEAIEHTIFRLLKDRGQTFAVAESCTGGLLGERITAIPGSSTVFRGGIIAYANDVKVTILGVDKTMLDREGAVSPAVAMQMASGVRRMTGSDFGLAITGIAGPDGGTPNKPVGLVYIALADARGEMARELRLGGGREVIREAAATMAMDLLRLKLENRLT